MIYRWGITVPANTPEASPVWKDLLMRKGVINKLDIHFPAGCVGLVHVAIFYGDTQLWPEQKGEYFATDDETISFTEYFELIHDWLEIRAMLWNEDDTYDHTISIRISVLPKWYVAPYIILKGLVDILKRILGIP